VRLNVLRLQSLPWLLRKGATIIFITAVITYVQSFIFGKSRHCQLVDNFVPEEGGDGVSEGIRL
jgi:hypothetical protein